MKPVITIHQRKDLSTGLDCAEAECGMVTELGMNTADLVLHYAGDGYKMILSKEIAAPASCLACGNIQRKWSDDNPPRSRS